jgi:hypothetical protein
LIHDVANGVAASLEKMDNPAPFSGWRRVVVEIWKSFFQQLCQQLRFVTLFAGFFKRPTSNLVTYATLAQIKQKALTDRLALTHQAGGPVQGVTVVIQVVQVKTLLYGLVDMLLTETFILQPLT